MFVSLTYVSNKSQLPLVFVDIRIDFKHFIYGSCTGVNNEPSSRGNHMLNQIFEFKNLCLTDTKVLKMQLITLVNLWLHSQSKYKEAASMRKTKALDSM